MSLALFEISYNLKRDCEDIIDGIEGKANSDMHKGMELAFKKIYEVLEEKGINLDELKTSSKASVVRIGFFEIDES